MDRTFGVELEFATFDRSAFICEKMDTKGLQIKNVGRYARSSGENWELKTDSSAGGNANHGNGYEVASRILKGNDGLKELEWYATALNNLRKNGEAWRVNRFCGVHVHLDVSDFNDQEIRNLITLFLYHEKVIYGIQPPSRYGNQYCHSIQGVREYEYLAGLHGARSPEGVRNIFSNMASRRQRYYGVNLVHYLTRGCIEILYGGGSLNPKKLLAWVLYLMGIVEKAKAISRLTVNPHDQEKTYLQRFEESRKYLRVLKDAGINHRIGIAHKVLKERFDTFSGNQANQVPVYGRVI